MRFLPAGDNAVLVQLASLDEVLALFASLRAQPVPGMGQMKQQLETVVTDKRVKHLEAILLSMTPAERANHNLLDAKRKRRIAAGSGRPVHEVNQLLKQYLEMKKMMSQMGDPRFMKRMQAMAGRMGGGMPF